MSEHAQRRRLEGRAELLEATRLRYRALRAALVAFTWRDRVRRNVDVLQEVVRCQAAVEEALATARAHAERDAWPPRAPLRRCVEEVASLQAELTRLCGRRLRGPGAPEGLAPRLAALEQQLLKDALSSRRPLLPLQRNALAHSLLSSRLMELGRASLFGDFLEQHFKRPFSANAPIPFDAEQARALAARMAEGEEALAALWALLEAADRSGGLVRHFQRRGRRAPVRPSRGPVDELLRTTFWLGMAQTRVRGWVDAALSPLEVKDAELMEVFAWLAAREKAPFLSLSPTERLLPARAALLELACGAWDLLREGRRGSPEAWERLAQLARDAEGAADPDLERLADSLRLFLRALAARLGAPPPAAGPAMSELLAHARRLLGAAPGPRSAVLR